jgi:hypothetical protein
MSPVYAGPDPLPAAGSEPPIPNANRPQGAEDPQNPDQEIDFSEPVQLTGHAIKTCDVFEHDLFDFLSSMNYSKA